MNIPESTLNQLFQSLGEYNPTTNEVMGKIAKVLIPLGLAILGILFMVEMTSVTKKFKMEDGGLGVEVLTDLAMKYIIAFVLIMSSGYIVDGIVWFGIQAAKWINSVVTITGTSDAIPQMGKVSWWAKPLVLLFQVFAYIALFLSSFITNILIFLRGIQLYIVKAMAPILIAFFVNDELRSIAVGYIKQIMALVLQGALLVLIVGLIPILMANDYLSFASFEGGVWDNAGALMINIMIYVVLIFKYVAIIIILIGSQGMAKRFMGAM
ncbi:type III secretion system protein PrgH [Enterococcus wangshanyuanii]|uniref:PrgH protein n=1 Tax=Enterococcus wangshanyuanii TaxID=2005703 RepID=A0ABQ1PU25_9ENTE|nr:type III secretion system protein PrgH [Enterococcus wangshanyuanii]GGD03362.1 PrgH protein [Enterococcus wangshanyuanii]